MESAPLNKFDWTTFSPVNKSIIGRQKVPCCVIYDILWSWSLLQLIFYSLCDYLRWCKIYRHFQYLTNRTLLATLLGVLEAQFAPMATTVALQTLVLLSTLLKKGKLVSLLANVEITSTVR